MRKRLLSAAVALLMLVTVILPVHSSNENSPEEAGTQTLPVAEGVDPVCENGSYALLLDTEEGVFSLYDKEREAIWHSSPEGRFDEDVAKGLFKMSLFSMISMWVIDTEQGNSESLVNSYTESVLANGTEYLLEENGILIRMAFPDSKITIPMKFTLTEHGFSVSINPADIVEDGSKRIKSISLLPYFGAGSSTDTGYLLIPDGSGVLAYFNNGKGAAAMYEEPIYGGDQSRVSSSNVKLTQKTYLPVFGIQKGENGFLAIVTEGAANGFIHAEVSGNRTSYNTACAVFELRNSRTTRIGENEVTDFEQDIKPIQSIAVDYRFCSDGYSGMAAVYKSYLREFRKLPDTASKELYIEFIGTQTEKSSFLGIPYDKTLPLTRFEEAQLMLEQIESLGVSELAFVYTGWSKTEASGKLSKSPSVISSLGGQKGLRQFTGYADEKGISYALGVNLLSYRKGGWFSSLTEDARNISGVSIMRYDYSISTYMQDLKSKPLHYLSYYKIPQKLEQFRKGFQKDEETKHLLLDDISSLVYADYSKKGAVTACHIERAARDGIASLEEGGFTLVSRAANGYALPYLSDIVGAPVSDSLFDLADEAVPFYQLAVSGMIGYSVPAINLSGDPLKLLLKALESGSGLSYIFAADAQKASEVNPVYYSVDLDDWIETLQAQAAIIRERNIRTENTSLKSHQKLADGVYKATYENGAAVIVNYSDADYNSPEGTVNKKGYLFV